MVVAVSISNLLSYFGKKTQKKTVFARYCSINQIPKGSYELYFHTLKVATEKQVTENILSLDLLGIVRKNATSWGEKVEKKMFYS